MAFHAFPNFLKGGFIGVDIFFVISGFLITSHIFESFEKGQFSFIDFFGRRIRRIFPALILVAACSLAVGWFVLLSDEYAQLGKHVASSAAFITNFILVDESGYFDTAAESKPMLHLWSLAVEEQFYIVWPFVIWLAWKRKLNLLIATTLLVLISFYFNLRLVTPYPTETFFWPLGRFWEILSGSILAWLFVYKPETLGQFKLRIDKFLLRFVRLKQLEADGTITSNLISFFGLLLIAYGLLCIDESFRFPSEWALFPVLGAVLVIISGSEAWLNRTFLMNPVVVWFGLISYPLYLWHWPILTFLQIIDDKIPHRDTRIAAVLLSILLAWLTYRFIERSCRNNNSNGIKTMVLLFSIVVVGGIGLLSHWKMLPLSPIATKYQKFSEARADWSYEPTTLQDGKIMGQHIFKGKGIGKVAFIGDSFAGQYWHRVKELDFENNINLPSVVFLSRNHCKPIPLQTQISKDKLGNTRCSDYYLAAMKLIEKDAAITSVVVAGNWPNFMNKDGSFTDQGSQWIEDIRKLVDRGIEVYIISKHPIATKFAPSFNRRDFLLDGGARDYAPKVLAEKFYKKSSVSQIKAIATISGGVFVDTVNELCDLYCYGSDDKGYPLYRDRGHMTASYVSEKAVFIDEILLGTYGFH